MTLRELGQSIADSFNDISQYVLDMNIYSILAVLIVGGIIGFLWDNFVDAS